MSPKGATPHLLLHNIGSTWGVCIPLHGNAVCILFISSERVGIFELNFAALIQVSIETF